MKRKSVLPLSLQARHLQKRVIAAVRGYEKSLSDVPVWVEELEPEQALSLMAACLRIGLRLPPEETLLEDMIERSQAQRGIKFRESSKG